LTRVSETAQKPTIPLELVQLFEPVRADLAAVEREFLKHVESRVDLIPRIGRYIQTSGGKRVRPAVLLMAARLCGYQGERAILYASVVEFIHTATLVHDDIIDDSELRRGRLAVHSQWGNEITVLLGDYLYIKSMGLALAYDSLDVIRLLCEVTLRMIEGELFQLTKRGDLDISEDEHFDIIRRKTSHLFAGCAKIGGLLGTATAEQTEALWQYGFNLGLAFQLIDDLLDYTADEDTLGKPVGSDLREGKMTLPIIYLLRRGGLAARQAIEPVVRDRALPTEGWREIRRLLAEHQAIDAAYRQAYSHAEQAKAQLAAFPPSRERDALAALADFVLARDR
jgi:octaprenyl-diphosphate synthase